MSVVIAYQSLNSNASREHDIDVSTHQAHTRKAHKMLLEKTATESASLRFPTLPLDMEPHFAVAGPAELLPTATDVFTGLGGKKGRKRKIDEVEKDDTEKMLGMFTGKGRQIYQYAQREFGQPCELLAFGELDAAHKSWSSVGDVLGKLVHVSMLPMACNCFSLHSVNPVATKFIAEGAGWLAASCKNVVVVFVHVPNKLATSEDAAITFYSQIRTAVAELGEIVDVVMGDTNQPNVLFSPRVISRGLGGLFSDGRLGPTKVFTPISPVDTHALTFKGTNSVDTKTFDVALYNVATVEKISVSYFSQLSHSGMSAGAYTDHMGVLVKVDKK